MNKKAQKEFNQHWGDCSIYTSIINGFPEDGICSCGFGRLKFSENPALHYEPGIFYSKERLESMGIWPERGMTNEQFKKIIDRDGLSRAANSTCSDVLKDRKLARLVKQAHKNLIKIIDYLDLDYCKD